MFSRTALSLRCVCVQAGRRRAFDACFFIIFHKSGGVVDENVVLSVPPAGSGWAYSDRAKLIFHVAFFLVP